MPAAPLVEFESIKTTQDAIDTVNSMFNVQLQHAVELKAEPNKAIHGDARSREAFWLLLAADTQRRVFLSRCASPKFWPRIRILVGSPPFTFLRPEDDDILRPAGITIGRVHMAQPFAFSTFSSNEIGNGHFSDAAGRSYRLVSDGFANDPGSAPVFLRATAGKRLILDSKLPRMSQEKKNGIIKGARHAPDTVSALLFPRSGETVELNMHSKLGNLHATIHIRSVEQRSRNSPVCRLYALVTR